MIALLSACTVAVDAGSNGSLPLTPTPEPQPSATQTPTPEPTATPEPTPSPEPTATPTPPDTTPVVLQGDSWAITEADVARMSGFIEQVHDLQFTRIVAVLSDDDIGANFIDRHESFDDDDWQLLTTLDLIEPGIERDAVNQLRRDRVRGLCCRGDGDDLVVVVEPRSTRLETEVIVVHELVHALHAQHRDLQGRAPRSAGFELPDPTAAVIEGIAQFIAFEYFAAQPASERAIVEPELLIINDELAEQSGRVPAAMLNFAYFTAPHLASAVYAERGAQGLSDLLASPPSTTEQVVYPDRWLADEDRVSQAPPLIPLEARWLSEGRFGVAMLGFMVDPVAQSDELTDLLRHWTGDRWRLYRHESQLCVAATVEMDMPAEARQLSELLNKRYDAEVSAVSPHHVDFETCLDE